MEAASRHRTTRWKMDEEKLARKVIWPLIRGHSCSICFRDLEDHYSEAAILTVCMHAYCIECIRKWSNLRRKCPLCNAKFNSWFCKLSLSSRVFQKEVLPLEDLTRNSRDEIWASHVHTRRLLGRTRVSLNDRRTRALPWRRSFGQPGLVNSDIIARRKLDWRASIYIQRLEAVPSTLSCLEQNKLRNSATKETMIQKIEPWIARELQAMLGDPAPTVIVHVATSQFFAWLEAKAKLPSGQFDVENFISPLRPFLLDKTSIFWHELRLCGGNIYYNSTQDHSFKSSKRCFAESCYNMETYDAVVEYKYLE